MASSSPSVAELLYLHLQQLQQTMLGRSVFGFGIHTKTTGIHTVAISIYLIAVRLCVPAGDVNDRLMALLTYFDVMYVASAARWVQRPTSDQGIPPLVIRHLPPLFPPPVWNVFEPTVNGNDRTNNLCEAWNRGFSAVIGQQHPSLWCAVEAFNRMLLLPPHQPSPARVKIWMA